MGVVSGVIVDIITYIYADASRSRSHTSWNADMSAHAQKRTDIYTHRESPVHHLELVSLAIL